ncbi:MAG: c-type cytochrome [Acidobacteriia bacterium]|nr:c-type cytochrome [Terriglobia bacterium]
MIIPKTDKQRAPARRLFEKLCVLVLFCTMFGIAIAAAKGSGGESSYFLPGNPRTGLRVFTEKGCIRCHAIQGEGGRSAPDLARSPASYTSASQLVAEMWNHAPRMWEKMRIEQLPAPHFEESEMTDLFAFLLSIRSFDDPGNPEMGRQVFASKSCSRCHSIQGMSGSKGGRIGPDLERWTNLRNAVQWAQTMWNHAAGMRKEMTRQGLTWPQFQENDMVNLIAYVRTQSSEAGNLVYIRPADPVAGKSLFQSKGCSQCHKSVHTTAVKSVGAPELGRAALPRTVGQFAGLMWNHAPRMAERMQSLGMKQPLFSDKEMADLISYLFSSRYFEISGNGKEGKQVFQNKGCAGCHTLGSGPAGVGPNLKDWQGELSLTRLAAALWNHGPSMLEHMQQQKIEWPSLRREEIENLIRFLEAPVPDEPSKPGRKKS